MEYIGKRISILRKDDEISFAILPASEQWKKYLLLVWLILWTACGVVVFMYAFQMNELPGDPEEMKKQRLFIFIWICFWLYFEYIMIKALRWRTSGVEKLWLKNGNLYYKREVGGRGKVHHYNAEALKDLRLHEEGSDLVKTLNRSYWVVGGETIAFDYYGKVVRFGLQMEEKEAQELIKRLNHAMKLFGKR